MKYFWFLLFLALSIPIRLQAQEDPIKWGKVPHEHLQMDHYAPDSNATAVILADYGAVHFSHTGDLIFKRHTRIKILSEGGYSWGTVTLPYYAKDRTQRIRDIKGQTITAGPDGKEQRHELDKKAVFTEDVDRSWKQVRFTLPALEPGAVIEYAYTLQSDNPVFLPDWTFQASEPTLWSEYRAEIPNVYSYVTASVGVLAFAVQESEEYNSPQGEGRKYRWAMRDVPALREEPFMTTPNNYRAKIEFQLASYYYPGHGNVSYLTSWDEVARELMDSPTFGRPFREPSRTVRRQAEDVTAGREGPAEKMRAVYDYVRTTIRWNQQRGVFPDQDLDGVLKTQRAGGPEMALLLVAMLRAAGLDAHPVLISTRSNGHATQIYPLVSQFNDLLAYVDVEGQPYLLNATDPLRPYDLLPVEALNGQGWLVREGAPAWISVEAKGRYQHQAALMATLDATGTLTGTLQASDGGYSALDKRHTLKAAESPEAFVHEAMLDGLEGVTIASCSFSNEAAVEESFRTEATLTAPAYAQVAGDYIYFNPVPIGRQGENPLRLPERRFPVDMTYTRDLVFTMRLALPEGYVLEELPRNIRVLLPLESGFYQRTIQEQEGMLSVMARLRIDRTVFEPGLYQELRSFFDRVVAAEAEQVVLKRAAASDEITTGGR